MPMLAYSACSTGNVVYMVSMPEYLGFRIECGDVRHWSVGRKLVDDGIDGECTQDGRIHISIIQVSLADDLILRSCVKIS